MPKVVVVLDSEGQMVALMSEGKPIQFSCELSQEPLVHPDLTVACWSCHNRDEGKQICSRCNRVSYCDAQCQKEHWPVHKISCKKNEPVEEEEEEEEPFDDSEDVQPDNPDDEGLEGQLIEMPRGGGGGGFRGGGGGFRGGGGLRRIPGGRPGGAIMPRRGGAIMPRRGGAIMPRRGGILPRSSFRTGRWGRTWHPSYWATNPLFWGLWGRYYTRWYPSNFWYVPYDYDYDGASLPSLNQPQWRFPPLVNPTQSMVDQQASMIASIRASIVSQPDIRAIMANTGFDIAPDVERGIFVWISTGGPVY